MISILFYSSIRSFLIHQVIFSYVDTFPNKWIVYECIITSVWNHQSSCTSLGSFYGFYFLCLEHFPT